MIRSDTESVIEEVQKVTSSETKLTHLMNFLVDKSYLSHTFPLLTDWIDSGEKVNLIIEKFDDTDVIRTLSENEKLSSEFLDKMSENVNTLQTSLRIMEILKLVHKGKLLKEFLNSKCWRTYSKSEVAALQEKYQVEYMYVELLIDWITHNYLISEETFCDIWQTINQTELCMEYIDGVRLHAFYQLKYRLPCVIDQGYGNYKFVEYGFDVSPEQIKALINNSPVTLANTCEVKDCALESKHAVTLQLCDSIPCYMLNVDVLDQEEGHYHSGSVVHWYVYVSRNGYCNMISMITNNREKVIHKLRTKYAYKGIRCRCLIKHK